MAISYASDILSLFNAKVGADAAYQSPGTFLIPSKFLAGGLTTIAVNTAGSYTAIPTLSFTGGDGSGGAATCNMKALSGVVAAAGTGYVPAEVITLGGTGTAAKMNVATTKVVSATINTAGSGYTSGVQTFTVNTGTGTQATVSITVTGGVPGGAVAVLTGGSYTVNPTLVNSATTGPAGSGLTLNLVMGVNTLTVNTAGSLSVLPAIPAPQVSTTGIGTGATITMTWGVDTITVTAAGNYALAPTVVFSSGAGAATASVSADSAIEQNILTLVEILRAYTAGAGSKAEARFVAQLLQHAAAELSSFSTASATATRVQSVMMKMYANGRRAAF